MLLQDTHFLDGGRAWLALRTLGGILVPFMSYGFHAEGNLLAMLPLLLAVRRWPTRGTLLAMGLVLALALLPGFGGIRQLDRFLWVLVLLVGLHCARHHQRVGELSIRLALGLTIVLGGGVMALRLLLGLEAGALPPPAEGLRSIAQATQIDLLSEAYQGGQFGAIRAGHLVPRPYCQVIIPPWPGPRGPLLVDADEFQVQAWEGLMRIRGPWRAGTAITVGLRAAPEVLQRLWSPQRVSFSDDEGLLRVTAREATPLVELRGR